MNAEPETTAPKPFVFVLMPFSENFNDTYELGIQVACSDAGAYCERLDEQVVEGSMLQRIYNQITKADVVVADMTGQNPNVFYEVGYAHALGQRVILCTRTVEDIPFDLRHYFHIVYPDISHLKTELYRQLKHYLENPREPKDLKDPLKLYLDRHPLVRDGTYTIDTEWDVAATPERRERMVYGRFTLFVENDAALAFRPLVFQPMLLTRREFPLVFVEDGTSPPTETPQGVLMHTFRDSVNLQPGSGSSLPIRLQVAKDLEPGTYDLVLRLVTDGPCRDIPFKVSLTDDQSPPRIAPQIRQLLSATPEGLTIQEITAALSEWPKKTATNTLRRYLDQSWKLSPDKRYVLLNPPEPG